MSHTHYDTYINPEIGPMPFCPGCGHHTIMKALDEALVKLQLDPTKVVIVTDIGCIGLTDRWFITSAFHGLHGRSLTYACGLKLARPDLTVINLMGDGAAGIGGTHFLNVARRNIGVTLIIGNNFNYGMTGGQSSPTTPTEVSTSTTPFGNREAPFDLSTLMREAGATYIARWTTVHARQVINAIKKGIQNKGFSFIEVLAQCPTQYGRRNKLGSAVEMMEWLKANSIPKEKADQMTPEERKGKFIIGELYSTTAPEFSEYMRAVTAEAIQKGEG